MNKKTNRFVFISIWTTLLYCSGLIASNGQPLPGGNVCDRPELLSADQITDVSARLLWADVGDAYEVEIREQGQAFTGIPTHAVPNDPPFEVTDLLPGRNYRFQVRTVCGAEYSEWSTPRSFATDLNNAAPCPLNFDLRDTSCASGGQFFNVHTHNAPGFALGTDVLVQGVRIMIEHPWRSDLGVWLHSPDGTRVQLIGGLNAGDKNIGDPAGSPCVQFVELTNDSSIALPLSAAAEQDNFTGYYLPLDNLAAFHNGQLPDGIWQLEICDAKANDRGKLRLFQIVFARADCAAVDSVSVSGVTENSALINWNNDPVTGDSIAIEYGPAGFLPGTGGLPGNGSALVVLQQPVSLPLQLSGLATLQKYVVYVRRQCAPGLWGPNSPGIEFFTNCPATLVDNPDTLDICPSGCTDPCPLPGAWRNVSGDDYEWKVRSGPGLTYPVAGPPAGPEGSGNYFYFRNSCSFSGANGKKAFLRTRCIQVVAPAGQPCHFSFDQYMNTKTGQMSTLTLQASTDGGQSWTTLQTWAGNQGKQWHRRYVNLSAYDGQVTLFQFVATGVFGVYGDIALDNLTFYGSTLAGTPDYVFYRDADNDGFGNASLTLVGCTPDLPPGYVAVAGDCNDNNANIYPGAPEILCNQVDENCNGMTDDGFIATPAAAGQSVCSGGALTLIAQGTATGQFYWFDSPSGGVILGAGSALNLSNLQSTRTVWLLDSLSGPSAGCASARVAVTATVYPTPRLGLDAAPVICQGQSFNLNALPVIDSANAAGGLSWHTALPPDFGNYLSNTVVSPAVTRTYYLFSETNFGCTDVDSVTITVNQRPLVQIAQGDSISSCKNRTITLNASASGSPSPYQFAWSTGLNFANIPVASGNQGNVTKTYILTVTDANGCTGTDQIKVHTLPNITQTSLAAVEDVSSCGGSDGSISLIPVDGVPPYQFAWSGPVSGSLSGQSGATTIPNLAQGGYRITITDASDGCSMVLPQIVINAPGLAVSVDTIIHPTCPGINNGAIVLNVSGTNPSYLWNNNQTSSTASGLGPGEYTVLIFDGACSQELVGLEVTAPSAIDIQLNAQHNVSCFGGDDGALDLAVFGATPPYEFLWTNDSTSEDITGIAAGVYRAYVFDANGCAFQSPQYLITQPPLLTLGPDSIANVLCHGDLTGYLSVNPAGGVPPYGFLWNTDAETSALGNLGAGSYAVTLTDKNECSVTWNYTVTQPPVLNISNIVKQDPLCAGATDGYIDVVPAGGVAPYSFDWSTGLPADTTALLDERGIGIYTVTLTDANGCDFVQNNIQLIAPQLLTLNLDSLSSVACFGEQTGYVEVSVEGAVGAVAVSWNFQPDDLVLNNAPAGAYIVRVDDSRGCAISDTFFITQPSSPLTVLLTGSSDALCFGEPNGSISIRTLGGTPPYTFLWNDGSTTESLEAIPAGAYTLTVTDAKGCTKLLGPVEVGQPPALVVAPLIKNIPCFGTLTGSIELTVSGGIPPYNYYWNNNLVTEDIFDLSPGTYSVTVVDNTGCAQILNDLIVKDLGDNFSFQTIKIQPISCSGANDGRIVVQASSGQAPYQFAWSAPVGLHPNRPNPIDSAINLAGGYYSVTVTDAAGCTGTSEIFLIEEAPPLSLFLGNVTNVLCKGDSTGAIPGAMSGGIPPYEFLWNNGLTTASVQTIPAGLYQLTVTDYRGCTVVSQPVEIEEPDDYLAVNLVQITDDACGTGEGAINIQVSGGTPPNNYLWSNGKITPDIANLSAGFYQLTVTDLHGCTTVSPQYLIEALSDPIGLVQIVINAVQCHGDSTGAIMVQASGGIAPYEYFWSNGLSGPTLNNLPANTYLLTVTDNSGCSHDFGIGVPQPAALGATLESTPGQSGWTATLHPSGGTPPYIIQWDAAAGNQTDSIATGLAAGYYDVTLTDAFDCSLVLNDLEVGVIGTGEPADGWQVRVLPNPASETLSIVLRQENVELQGVELRSGDGAILLSSLAAGNISGRELMIDLAGIPSGMYWVQVRLTNGKSVVKRVVKI